MARQPGAYLRADVLGEGRVRGGVAKKSSGQRNGAYANTLKKASERPQMPKRTGKRPAVAARKAAAKAAKSR